MNEGINRETSEIPTSPDWPQIIGPFYKIDGKENILWFCRESWQEDKIPFLFGKKQIGKTGILTPYLKSALGGNIAIFDTGSLELDKLNKLPPKIIFLASIDGNESENYDIQCNKQIENICSRNLFKPQMFEKRRIELRLNNDDVDNMVNQLTGIETKNLGIKYPFRRKRIISAFHQDRPIRKGIDALEELLGNKFL